MALFRQKGLKIKNTDILYAGDGIIQLKKPAQPM